MVQYTNLLTLVALASHVAATPVALSSTNQLVAREAAPVAAANANGDFNGIAARAENPIALITEIVSSAAQLVVRAATDVITLNTEDGKNTIALFLEEATEYLVKIADTLLSLEPVNTILGQLNLTIVKTTILSVLETIHTFVTHVLTAVKTAEGDVTSVENQVISLIKAVQTVASTVGSLDGFGDVTSAINGIVSDVKSNASSNLLSSLKSEVPNIFSS